nr:hypothetical protein [Patescibacteria group bacterium]
MKGIVLNKVIYSDPIFVERMLPTEGKIFVKSGDIVNSYDKIGETLVAKDQEVIKFKGEVLVSVGDKVSKGDILAKERYKFFKFKEFLSPINGKVREIDEKNNQIFIESTMQSFSLISGVDGEVMNVSTSKSVLLKTKGLSLKGVSGFGDEVCGEVLFLSSNLVGEKDVTENVRGKILVAKGFSPSAVSKAKTFNALGFVFASSQYFEVKKYIEEKTPLIVLEGFGDLPFNPIFKTLFQKFNSLFGILRTYENSLILTGRTLADFDVDFNLNSFFETEILVGDIVQLFNKENFGSIAKVTEIETDKLKVSLIDASVPLEIEIDPQNIGIIA